MIPSHFLSAEILTIWAAICYLVIIESIDKIRDFIQMERLKMKKNALKLLGLAFFAGFMISCCIEATGGGGPELNFYGIKIQTPKRGQGRRITFVNGYKRYTTWIKRKGTNAYGVTFVAYKITLPNHQMKYDGLIKDSHGAIKERLRDQRAKYVYNELKRLYDAGQSSAGAPVAQASEAHSS